jgi:ketosteroid isomerase-like protein
MPDHHLEIVKQGIEAFNRGDWDATLKLCAEDIVWIPLIQTVDGQRALIGHEMLRSAWVSQREALGGDAFGVEPKEIRDLGAGTVLAHMRVRGEGHTSGVPIELDYVQLWTIRDRLVARVDKYPSVADALADCGVAQ